MTTYELAPDFTLPNHRGGKTTLSDLCHEAPVILVFYPGDFTPVCTKQLCGYRDGFADLQGYGVQLVGISPDGKDSHVKFANEYALPFLLLTDAKHEVAKSFGAKSLFMLGRVSRATYIIDKKRQIVWKHVEPTIVTHRNTKELVTAVAALKINNIM